MLPTSAAWSWSSPACATSAIDGRAVSFDTLGLGPALRRAVADMGLAEPTPIQARVMAPVLQGRDVWAAAPTGSGKTLAFALPIVQGHERAARRDGYRRPVRTLVLLPTRELALQVGEVLTHLAWPLFLRVGVVHGGVSINPQMMALRGGADILVATPGRLLDLVAHQAVRLGDVQQLVLDEADRLLDAGFADELQRVLALLPAQRQTLLFSATFAPEVQALAEAVLHDPLRLGVQAPDAAPAGGEGTPHPDIRQHVVAVDAPRRTALLCHLLATQGWPRALVFVATRYACEHVAAKLARAGIAAAPLHGELAQGARQRVLADFKAGRLRVLVTTDLAARGIDIAHLPVVVNYDLPRSATDHTHRIGRTGRAGAQGEAWSFVTAETHAHWGVIRQRTGIDRVPEPVPGFEPTQAPVPVVARVAPDGGGIKGRRPSKKDKLRAAQAAAAAAGKEPPRG